MATFRVHFSDGETRDVDAADPNKARDLARAERKAGGKSPGIITKVKQVREKAAS